MHCKSKRHGLLLLALALLIAYFLWVNIQWVTRNRKVFSESQEWQEGNNHNLTTYLSVDPLLRIRPLLPNRSFEFAFFVISSPSNSVRRNEIRQMWGKHAHKLGYPVIFVLGEMQLAFD